MTVFVQLKDEAVALCDVIAPPDHILQSAIGSSDGQVGNLINYWHVKNLLFEGQSYAQVT